MNKKGFTLIEIIVCIILLVLVGVGSVVGVKVYENKSNEKFYKQFDNALEIYLSDHSEIYTNLSDNVEGAVVTLEVLKNEGLIKDNIIDPSTNETLDYSNNYYVLSDAVLLSDEIEEENACKGQVELSVIKSWETLSGKVDTSSVLYVCPKTEKGEKDEDITKLEERIESLEYILSVSDLGSKNYVMFDVNQDNDKTVTWGNDDLWRIVSTNNGIKIMYDEPIKHNFKYNNLESLKNSILGTTGDGRCSYIRLSTGEGLLIGNSNVKHFHTYYGSEWICNTEAVHQDHYVYNNVLYSEGTKRPSNDYRNILNPTEKCPDTNRKLPGYLYVPYSGTVEQFIYSSCYLEPSYIENVQNISDVKYYNSSILENNKKYQLRDVMSINYYSIFDFKTSDSNSIKNMIYNQINSNIRGSIIENSYQYNYRYSSSEVTKTSDTYKDLIGTISYDEGMEMIEKDPSSLIGKSIMVGQMTYDGSTHVLDVSGTSFGADVLVSQGIEKKLYDIDTASFYPTVTLNKSYRLMLDINNYPESYKAACGSYELGSKDCPYLIKIGDYYSNGERVS